MKIVAMSDNHGDRQIIEQIINKYEGKVDAIVHCGDSELKADDPLVSKLQIVMGNMDFEHFPESRALRIDQKNILITHSHLQNVNSGLLTLELFAQSHSADIVTFGHTHQLGVSFDKGILFVNPGSISYPRGRYASIGGTYASIITDNHDYLIQFFDRQLTPVPELKFRFSSSQ